MKDKIRQTAAEMVAEAGLINLTRSELCSRAGLPDGSFYHVMGCTFTEFVEQLQTAGITGTASSVTKTRTTPALRREEILGVALELSKTIGYRNVRQKDIAERAGISPGLINRYFGTLSQMQRAIMRAAVSRRIPAVVAQGLTLADPQARKADAELRQQAINSIIANA